MCTALSVNYLFRMVRYVTSGLARCTTTVHVHALSSVRVQNRSTHLMQCKCITYYSTYVRALMQRCFPRTFTYTPGEYVSVLSPGQSITSSTAYTSYLYVSKYVPPFKCMVIYHVGVVCIKFVTSISRVQYVYM